MATDLRTAQRKQMATADPRARPNLDREMVEQRIAHAPGGGAFLSRIQSIGRRDPWGALRDAIDEVGEDDD